VEERFFKVTQKPRLVNSDIPRKTKGAKKEKNACWGQGTAGKKTQAVTGKAKALLFKESCLLRGTLRGGSKMKKRASSQQQGGKTN